MIEIAQLFGRNGMSMPVRFIEQVKTPWNCPDVVDFLQPVKIEGTLTNEDDIFKLEAKGEVEVTLSCSRCLAPVRKELCFEIKERFAHTGRGDEETETFSKDQIDLTDIIMREISHRIPMKVICREECKGLCPVCGKDLNEGDCNCDLTVFDPRLESLRTLFNVDEEV